MPANLTLQYLKAEEEYRRASTPDEELRCLQVMLRELPKHKGTDKLQAELKHKISRAKADVETAAKSGKKGHGVRVPRQGAGRVILVGGPNAGKSQFVKAVTRATPEVAPYPFTTREPMPAMMPFEDVMIQVIDTPPITADYFDPATQGLIRGSDLALLLVDLGADEGIEQLQEVLDHLNKTKTRLARESYLDENDIGLSYTQAFLVLNKLDDPQFAERRELLHEFCELEFDEFAISAEHGEGLEPLKAAIFQALDVVRIYTKLPTAKEPDYDKPFTIRRGGTLLEIAEQIHRDFAKTLKGARVWGTNVHDGTMVKADYVLSDKDVVELHV
ncbi:MAG: 50S ribosome-binding GTPase [Planctomycetales bacterium]|nr:50S ribosome-binding GTPase [Planctomycetales bacterium]